MDNNDNMAMEQKPISFKKLIEEYKPPKIKSKGLYSDAKVRTYFDIRFESHRPFLFSEIQEMLMLIWSFAFKLNKNVPFTIKITKLYMDDHQVRDIKELSKANANSPTNS